MKNLYLALAIFLAVSPYALAGSGYCDSKQSSRETQNCYKAGIEVYGGQIKKNYQLLMQSPKLSQQQKNDLQKNQDAWVDKLDSYCGNDIRCVSDSVMQRSSYLYHLVHKL